MKFRVSPRTGGWFFILDSNHCKVCLRDKGGLLKPKRFKTIKLAREFVQTLEYKQAIQDKIND